MHTLERFAASMVWVVLRWDPPRDLSQNVQLCIGGSGPKKREAKGRCRCMSKTIGSGNFADLGSMSGNLRTRDQRPHTFMLRCPETSETQHEACEILGTMKWSAMTLIAIPYRTSNSILRRSAASKTDVFWINNLFFRRHRGDVLSHRYWKISFPFEGN